MPARIIIMELQTNPHNPRTISKDAYEKLKASIERNPDGLTANKIAYKDGIIISGNQRYRAILELGLTIKPEWLKDLSGWTQEQIDEWIIQSNISAGEWDWDILANEWEQTDLEEWGVDTSQEWDNKKELPEDIDDIPEVKTPVSKLGDLWLLDGHRVLCGDSTDQATVERLMDGKKADMVFTDPPYALMGNSTGVGGITDNNMILPFFRSIFQRYMESVNSMTHMYMCCDWHSWSTLEKVAAEFSSPAKSMIVWDKKSPGMGSNYMSQHELVMFTKINSTDKTKTTGAQRKDTNKRIVDCNVWQVARQRDGEHNAQKPIELIDRALKNSSMAKDLIIDLFLGSGSTLIACEQTDRTCYGLELDPQYVDVICKRWQTLTGQMPILETTGETHDFSS